MAVKYKMIEVDSVVHKRITEIKKKTGFPIKVIVAKAVDLLVKQTEKENGKGERKRRTANEYI